MDISSPFLRTHLSFSSTTSKTQLLHLSRRTLLLLPFSLSTPTLPSFSQTTPPTSTNSQTTPTPNTTITDRVFLDFSLCPSTFLPDRNSSSAADALCDDAVLLGRLVLGLYGRLVPRTVANFKAMCAGAYRGSVVHKLLPGQYLAAGRQGRRDRAELPLDLQRNTEAVESRSFALTHSRPGTLSLCLGENDDEEEIKLDPNYRNVEFLITTGPGPCPQLDGRNIVFGTVLEGLDVVTTIAAIPTYKPSERIRQFNDLAEFFGDERAQIARTIWNRPLKTVYISDCGELKVAKPSLSPSLP